MSRSKMAVIVWTGIGTELLKASDLCSAHSETAIATFEDPNLEEVVRSALLIDAQDALTCGLLAGLYNLNANGTKIESLEGIQNLSSLRLLYLSDNSITDISALSGLVFLRSLGIGFNSITDLRPLSGLANLKELTAEGNPITDISPLSGLANLELLILSGNPITDISALSGLTKLWFLGLENSSLSDLSALIGLTNLTTLRLHRNAISDVSALSGLTELEWLRLGDNPDLTDIGPLMANAGLGWADRVYLDGTNVSCLDVRRLRAKAVWVVAPDCP